MLIFLLFFFASSHMPKDFCGVDKVKLRPIRHLDSSFSYERLTTWSSIRIDVDWSNVLNASKSKYSKYLEAAFDYYRNALKVHRLANDVVYDSSLDYMFYYPPQDFYGKTLSVDIMLQMYEINDSSQSYVARCGPSAIDLYTFQPIAIYLEINTAYMDSLTHSQLVMVLTHELTHGLGFINDFYPYFIKSNGELYGDTATVTETKRGKTVTMLATANVIEKARAATGCNSLKGVELEDIGGDGSAGSHWDKRIMYNDFMNPQVLNIEPVYSDITLALLEDSGWYLPDYSYGQTSQFGYQRGCDFQNKKCIINEQPAFPEFCVDTVSESLCSFNLFGYGYCYIGYYDSSLELYEQYFSDSTLGGDPFADYCPVVYDTVDCSTGVSPISDYGETFCDECRCVEGTYSLSGNSFSNHGACHQIVCGSNYADIYIGAYVVRCTTSGEVKTISGVSGTITCPDLTMICDFKSCTDNCYGNLCTDGVCEASSDSYKIYVSASLLTAWLL